MVTGTSETPTRIPQNRPPVQFLFRQQNNALKLKINPSDLPTLVMKKSPTPLPPPASPHEASQTNIISENNPTLLSQVFVATSPSVENVPTQPLDEGETANSKRAYVIRMKSKGDIRGLRYVSPNGKDQCIITYNVPSRFFEYLDAVDAKKENYEKAVLFVATSTLERDRGLQAELAHFTPKNAARRKAIYLYSLLKQFQERQISNNEKVLLRGDINLIMCDMRDTTMPDNQWQENLLRVVYTDLEKKSFVLEPVDIIPAHVVTYNIFEKEGGFPRLSTSI